MSDQPSFEFLADELEQKSKNLGNLGVTLKFTFEGMGNVFIDARQDQPSLSRNSDQKADFMVSAPLKVWMDLRAKRIAPHVAAMTRKIKFEGDMVKGMKLAPKIMAVL
jgi:putative sterol carrier protein